MKLNFKCPLQKRPKFSRNRKSTKNELPTQTAFVTVHVQREFAIAVFSLQIFYHH